MQTRVTFTGKRLDGGPDEAITMAFEHEDAKGLFVARMRILTMFGSVGGLLFDNPDGSVKVLPFSLFSEVLVTNNSIVTADSMPSSSSILM